MMSSYGKILHKHSIFLDKKLSSIGLRLCSYFVDIKYYYLDRFYDSGLVQLVTHFVVKL